VPEPAGDGVKVVVPGRSFSCGDLEEEQQGRDPLGVMTVPVGNGPGDEQPKLHGII
jgi:hypothetical protein